MNLTFERLTTRPGHYELHVTSEQILFSAVGSINEWVRIILAMQQKRSFRGINVGAVRSKQGYGFRNPGLLHDKHKWILVPHSEIPALRHSMIQELFDSATVEELKSGRMGSAAKDVLSDNLWYLLGAK
jgi:hypothetical protein